MAENGTIELDIIRLALLGDGVADYGGTPVFVPFTLPGERIVARIDSQNREGMRGELLEVQVPSPERALPPCQHFTRCGGCQLQHLSKEAYTAFKRDIAIRTAARLDVKEDAVSALIEVPPETRRRAEVKVAVAKGAVTLGFLSARSTQVIDIHACHIVEPELFHSFAAWRTILSTLKNPSAIKAIAMTLTDSGMEAILRTEAKLPASDRERLKAFAAGQGFASLSEQETVLYRHRHPAVHFAGVSVELPPGAFLQATHYSESRLVERVKQACEGFERIIDLYSGCGTFTFPLVEAGHRVSAFEGAAEMAIAGHNAAGRAKLEHRVQFAARDLFKDPVSSPALAKYDAAVINPPRNGALPQVKALAASGLKRIVMVSCNPATFERDARELLAGGYRLDRLTPVDQFLWSHHLEIVGVFNRL